MSQKFTAGLGKQKQEELSNFRRLRPERGENITSQIPGCCNKSGKNVYNLKQITISIFHQVETEI